MRRFFAFVIALAGIGFFVSGVIATFVAPTGVFVVIWLLTLAGAGVIWGAWGLSSLIEAWLEYLFPKRAKAKPRETDY